MAAIDIPIIAVHISNVHNREEFRKTLMTGRYASGVISGLGLEVYRLAIDSFWERSKTH
jgi:3-dehydroquinate dehydratase-2